MNTLTKSSSILVSGQEVYLDELQGDVKAAKEKGLGVRWAFTPETVQALLDEIKRVTDSNTQGKIMAYSEEEEEEEVLKNNILNLVKDHKKQCTDYNCNISMHLVEVLIRKAGIELTEEESNICM